MVSVADPDRAELKITGSETSGQTVSADLLARALGSFQQIVYLIAAAEEARPIGQRFAVTEGFKERYAIRCGLPASSGYGVPLSLEEPGPLFRHAPGETLFTRALAIFRSAALGSLEDLAKLLPDPRVLNRVLLSLQSLLPRPGDTWAVEFAAGSDRIAMDSTTYRSIRRIVAPEAGEDTEMTVTGELIQVDFSRYQVVIRYAPTGREIQCACTPEILETVIQTRREPIQVTGRFLLDAAGNPERLSDVSRIEPVDLSPMTFDRIEWNSRQLEIQPPLVLHPEMDKESGQLYVLTDDELGIDVFAHTRAEVVDELAEQVLFLWDTYGQESPDRLTARAQKLREALISRITEVSSLAAQSEER